jgi:signal transduction histidine kinase/outer membrane murein-binding lipoprotein Lpp
LVVLLLACVWGYIRLFLFREVLFSITFVLPMLVCIWTGYRWQLWSMAVIFCGMAAAKVLWIMPQDRFTEMETLTSIGTTFFNVIVGAIVIHAIIGLREKLENHNSLISEQNAELEAQAEELSQQNEEIKAQAEELAQQNEQIEAQAEELTRQNEDLSDLNVRLMGREEILQGLLESSHRKDSPSELLNELCRRAMSVIGAPAGAVAVFERGDGCMTRCAHVAAGELSKLPDHLPLTGSIAEVVFHENRTAYVSDLRERPDLAAPFGVGSSVRSLLATPLIQDGERNGLFAVLSAQPSHWTEEQFRIVEWVAAQCGLMMETLRGQRALATHAQALESANRYKDRFLAMLSHELRTPLTPVLAASGALEKDPRLPEDVQRDLQMIHRNARIQSRLIDDLLDLTRISRGKIELNNEVLSADVLLSDAASIVAGDLDAKSQNLSLDLSAIQGASVYGDGARLQQVFWNLLKNAIKFSEQGAAILVTAFIVEDRLHVEVKDHGIGIDGVDVQRIFLPFEQSMDAPRNSPDGGLGLGLAIARAIIELHGGGVSVQSEGRGKGATFVVELPLVFRESISQPSVPDASACPSKLPDRGSAIRLLLIEDHGDTGLILTRLLESAGYHVVYAATAAAGFAAFQAGEFDLVLSDIGLPDESGMDLIRRIRQLRPDTKGICLSGYGMEDDIRACHEAGFTEHVTKPVEMDRLEAAIIRVLGRKA